jgi:hypothetical protein
VTRTLQLLILILGIIGSAMIAACSVRGAWPEILTL